MSLSCLTTEILSLFNNLQTLPLCHGIYEEQLVYVCEQYNQRNTFKNGRTKFHIDETHILNHPKKKMAAIYITVRSTGLNGKECQFVLLQASKTTQIRCDSCQQLLRHCVRKMHAYHTTVCNSSTNDSMSPRSTTRMSSLDHKQLLFRCRKMAEYVERLKKSNSRIQMRLNEEKRKGNLVDPVDLPCNVKLTALGLGSLVELAISKEYLSKESFFIYALLCNTVTSLIKAETAEKEIHQSVNKVHPKGMRFHPVILKWCVELANKCGKSGYELVKEMLPIPFLSTVYAYRQSCKSYQPISSENLKLLS